MKTFDFLFGTDPADILEYRISLKMAIGTG